MTERTPIPCMFNGEAFQPVSPYWERRANREYGKGEVVRLVDQPERSGASHNHFFASVESAWESLPPLLAERWPSSKHLRSYALIKAGYCDIDNVVCASHADAMRVAAFTRAGDEYALVDVKKNVVTRYRAKSQSYRSMGKEEFQASKDAVLRIIAEILDISRQELADAGRAA
jgi:hypothetical protein